MKLRIATAFLLILLLILCGCDKGAPGETGYGTTAPENLLTIAENGTSSYTIVRSDADGTATKAAMLLRKTIRESVGIELGITTDWKNNPVSDYEILVGATTREGEFFDAPDRAGLLDDGYLIEVVGTRVLLTGDGEQGCSNAVKRFLELFMTADGIRLPDNYYERVDHVFPVKSLSIGGADISEYSIVYDSDDACVRKAASELHDYLRFACGADLPISSENTNGKRILIHATDDNSESFSYQNDADGIVITGSAMRGALYGVYDFLENCIGMRFLTEDSEYCLESDQIALNDLNRTYELFFEYRDSFWTAYFPTEISVKRMLNSSHRRNIPESLGGMIGITGQFVHTMETLNGTPKGEQPCLSDETVYETVLASVLSMLAEHPDAKIISVSQNDNENYCTCPTCSAVDEEEGSHAGTVIRFVNRIAEAVEKDYPDVSIHTLAYRYSRSAPKITVPRDNVIVQLCTIECCFLHALNDPSCERNAALKEDIEAWGKICKRIYIWDYVTNFRYYVMPFPDFDILDDNMRFFYENNARGMLEQGNYEGQSGEFGELRGYLLTLLLKNPYMTEAEYDTAINEFMRGYYGPGWESVRAYYDFIRACAGTRKHIGIYDDYATTLGGVSFFGQKEQFAKWFDTALSLAENEVQEKHIRCTAVSADYIRLSQEFDKIYYTGTEEEKNAIVAENTELYQAITNYGIPLHEYVDNSEIVAKFDRNPIEW
ncbi:MAG: DUF4838 domain-containing protein [Clostridia bacterium]|nr:DUF4838 domain-containing protein [Clostridia bacterium]